MSNELQSLRRWKAEALPLLAALNECHELLPDDRKARLGHLKHEAVIAFIMEHAAQ